MLGHDHVADEPEAASIPDHTESFDKGVSRARGAKKRQATIAAKSKEVQMAEAVDSFEALRHDPQPKAPPS